MCVCSRATALVCLIHSDIIRHRFLARTEISRVASPRIRNGTFRHLLSLRRRRGRSIKTSIVVYYTHLDDSPVLVYKWSSICAFSNIKSGEVSQEKWKKRDAHSLSISVRSFVTLAQMSQIHLAWCFLSLSLSLLETLSIGQVWKNNRTKRVDYAAVRFQKEILSRTCVAMKNLRFIPTLMKIKLSELKRAD